MLLTIPIVCSPFCVSERQPLTSPIFTRDGHLVGHLVIVTIAHNSPVHHQLHLKERGIGECGHHIAQFIKRASHTQLASGSADQLCAESDDLSSGDSVDRAPWFQHPSSRFHTGSCERWRDRPCSPLLSWCFVGPSGVEPHIPHSRSPPVPAWRDE